MWQPNHDLVGSLVAEQRARHKARNQGIDLNIVYLVPKQLAQMAGRPLHFIYSEVRFKRLVPVRRGPGRGITLIHPEEAKRWLLSLEGRKERKKKNAEAA